MGKIPQGIMGPVSGKVGPVIGSSWKGKPYLKKSHGRTPNVSEKELANRKKFGMAQAWLSPLLDFVREGFRGYSQYSEGFVAAKSYLLKNAVEGEMFDISINPALVKVSHGDLPLPKDIAVMLEANKLVFTWDKSGKEGDPGDQVMVLAYDIENKDTSLARAGQFRGAGVHEQPLSCPPNRTYHIYFAMVAVDRSRQSDSVYLGTVTT